ncbi:hypothetical protein GOC57_30930 [Sinorhizobium meliloti]|uniref:hypothetical protein n=1 Tax=Rhizobium meliloti TaxID=382 RepID=UPI0012960217|nr:hypothetical protein [Sinorhizobium meliloti]MDW9378031.1 hypothetical protein [Sinorhizobium meliloti]MDW9496632.1 hypothetical protein [Sinorhizobium meliloti]MDW9565184.1 hypothetical protein [Sinorhizobium meliloti]MDW9652610.1 hypothetical protein [Sinorhizobium meliloti]MDW9862808.1 hypothetical protein [Sinorhizobium meliloti]
MSDGPHKSLPLRHGYQRVAAWAFRPAFSINQIGEAAELALLRDVAIEVAPTLKQIVAIADGQDLLSLASSVNDQLDRLRVDPAVDALAASTVEGAQMAVKEGYRGIVALEKGLASALSERLAAGGRAMEEHYLVKLGPGACQQIRRRINETIGHMNTNGTFDRMAKSILGDRSVSVARTHTIHDGLDQGVAF